MTYPEATQTIVTASEAQAEIAKHGHDDSVWLEFVGIYGHKATYRGSAVLAFLGY